MIVHIDEAIGLLEEIKGRCQHPNGKIPDEIIDKQIDWLKNHWCKVHPGKRISIGAVMFNLYKATLKEGDLL